jgi:hypothetical protein
MTYSMKPLGCDLARIKGMSEQLIISHYENNYGGAVRHIMRTFAILLILLGYCSLTSAASAAQSDDCKLCREDHQACVKAHSQGACKVNYDICMKHCRRK